MLKLCCALTAIVAIAVAEQASFVAAPEYASHISIGEAVQEGSITITLVLKQRNIDTLKRLALQVSDPDSPRYGQYLSSEKIARLTAPKPEHVRLIKSWLYRHGVEEIEERNENLFVTLSVEQAETMFSTRIHKVVDHLNKKQMLRAQDYSIPSEVADALDTIFGLHGVPLPPRQAIKALSIVPVTPKVIDSTYSVSGVTVNRQDKNIQAVAEFQDQYMNKADLVEFFKNEVPNAQTGDDQVSKFVGSPYVEGSSVEAALDIQFIMGVADGVKTQFWEYPNNDFCADLNNYTSYMLTVSEPPLVNSISYGWQGNLSQVGCVDSDVNVVDANWAKLAAKGISIMISSGDSGSGYAPPRCDPTQPGENGVEITKGDLITTQDGTADECCSISQQEGGEGWTWYPPNSTQTENKQLSFSNSVYNCEFSEEPKIFVQRDVYILNGQVGTSGGTVKVHNSNGTFADTTMDFGAEYAGPGDEKFRNISMSVRTSARKHETFNGQAVYLPGLDDPIQIRINDPYTKETAAFWRNGPNPPPPPPMGTCKIYKTVTAHGKASSNQIQSGGPAIVPPSKTPDLFPSWPASSPWVTAVGATRFTNGAGSEEMASDQFGSGGGFSTMFNQSDARWQATAVAAYVAQGSSLPNFPPSGSFPATGRATPDVAGLGEGYQVYVGGQVEPVGGTSASSPMFAALVSLINEERIAKNMPVMGFLNPFLYKNPDAFFDVVKGTNAISRGGTPLKYGFAAAKGWDAATGLGTPHFDKLLAAALQSGEKAQQPQQEFKTMRISLRNLE